MKTVWIKVSPWDKSLVTEALESGADGIVVDEPRYADIRQLGLITIIGPDGDLKLGEEVVEVVLESKADVQRVVQLAQGKTVIVRATDWTIIPLENILAEAKSVFAEVSTAEEAEIASGVLEVGTAGVVLNTRDPVEIRRTVRRLKSEAEKVVLNTARVVDVQPLGIGDRVCVDTCSNMGIGEGMLVGSSSASLFLIHSESVPNPYVEPRPFRVNAGPVHAYIRVPEGRTRYLSELEAGDPALIVAANGSTRLAVIGRVKVERRPLALVRAEYEGATFTTIVQNAETIRFVTPEGQPISVVALKAGDQILVALEEAGRHFGIKIEETIDEK
ncbi:MAG: 3-dehydroquinate synthase II [Candidatus Zipacnadales bacterium]